MKRPLCLFTAVVACMLLPVASLAQQNIPVERVVLSTSGLAYFEHGATVSGAETLSFPVRIDQVNDLLKSLLIFDPEGRLKNVTLPGKAALEQIFRDLPFSEAELDDPVALLNAYQGAEVEISDGGQTDRGLLVRIMPETDHIEDRTITRNRVTVLTDNGLKSFILENVQNIQLVDAAARGEVETALNAVRDNSETGQRRLDINLMGESERAVTLSYVVEAPLWKTAYRAVLPAEGSERGHLQGWAVVENMTGGDWEDIELSLTSGNPVTLQQDLYPSYYVSRPEIPVEVFGRVMPRQDTGTITLEGRAAPASQFGRRQDQKMQAESFSMADDSAVAESMAMPRMASASPVSGSANLAQAQQLAESREATAQIIFRFPGRFDLASGQSMMLPFINREIEMESIALYQPDVEPEHPFLSVSMVNEGDTSLPPGILTLYAEGAAAEEGLSFVGDSELDMLPKGDKRMISYALDHKTRIDRDFKSENIRRRMTASEGVLRTSVQYVEATTYTIAAPAEEDRIVMIEHPRRSGFELVGTDEDGIEATPDHYRIRIPVSAGETVTRNVTLERTAWETIQIENISLNQLRAYASTSGDIDEQTRAVFEQLAEYRQALAQVEQQIRALEARRQEIYTDQARLRQNIQSLTGSSDLRSRYLSQMNTQEDTLEDIREQLETLNQERSQKRNRLQQYIRNIEF